MPGLVFIVAVLAAVLAIVFFVQARSNGTALLQLRKEQDELKKAGEGDRAKVKELESELKTKGQHLVEAREKLADVRKKGESKGQKSQPRGAREAELEEDLQSARDLAAEAHNAESKARKEIAAAKAEAAAAKAELAAAQGKVREFAEKAGLVVPSKPAPAPIVISDAQLTERITRIEAELKKASAEVIDLRTALQAAKDKELNLKDETRKAKGRAESNNRVYLVAKGETELLKERLAGAERQLWKAGIVLPKPEAKERPKATGPLAADRPREEKAEAPAAESAEPKQAARLETVANVDGVLVAQVSESAAAIATGLQAAAPLRRKAKGDEPLKN